MSGGAWEVKSRLQEALAGQNLVHEKWLHQVALVSLLHGFPVGVPYADDPGPFDQDVTPLVPLGQEPAHFPPVSLPLLVQDQTRPAGRQLGVVQVTLSLLDHVRLLSPGSIASPFPQG